MGGGHRRVCAFQGDGDLAAESVPADHGELVLLHKGHQRIGADSRDAVRPTRNVDEVQPIVARDEGYPICAGNRAPRRFGGHGELTRPLADGEPVLAPVRGPPHELSGVHESDPHLAAGAEGDSVWTGRAVVEHRSAVCGEGLGDVGHEFTRLSSLPRLGGHTAAAARSPTR